MVEKGTNGFETVSIDIKLAEYAGIKMPVMKNVEMKNTLHVEVFGTLTPPTQIC